MSSRNTEIPVRVVPILIPRMVMGVINRVCNDVGEQAGSGGTDCTVRQPHDMHERAEQVVLGIFLRAGQIECERHLVVERICQLMGKFHLIRCIDVTFYIFHKEQVD